MQHARFTGDGHIEIATDPLPEPGPEEVRIRVLRCAMCGSDNRLYRTGAEHTPGHEIVGVVDAPDHPRHGRRVLVYIPIFCGECAMCRRGLTNQCPHIEALVGWQRPGGFAEALCVPERNLIDVPDDIPTDLAPLLLDTIGTAAHAIRLASRVISHGRAAVLGAGPLGLGVILALQRLGFPEVVSVEPVPQRRAIAEEFGAPPLEANVGDRSFELVFEASGNHEARSRALHLVAPLGVAVFLGESDRPWTLEPSRALRRKDFFALRSFYFPLREVDDNFELLRADAERYRRLVDRHYELADLPDGYAAFASGELLKPEVAFEPENT